MVTLTDNPVGSPANLMVSALTVRASWTLKLCASARVPMAAIITIAVDAREQTRSMDRIRILIQCVTLCVIAVFPQDPRTIRC